VVCLRCTGAPARIPTLSRERELGARDKPLLMEEINFGLNRSPATL